MAKYGSLLINIWKKKQQKPIATKPKSYTVINKTMWWIKKEKEKEKRKFMTVSKFLNHFTGFITKQGKIR